MIHTVILNCFFPYITGKMWGFTGPLAPIKCSEVDKNTNDCHSVRCKIKLFHRYFTALDPNLPHLVVKREFMKRNWLYVENVSFIIWTVFTILYIDGLLFIIHCLHWRFVPGSHSGDSRTRTSALESYIIRGDNNLLNSAIYTWYLLGCIWSV